MAGKHCVSCKKYQQVEIPMMPAIEMDEVCSKLWQKFMVDLCHCKI
jgi:hypothetical protein